MENYSISNYACSEDKASVGLSFFFHFSLVVLLSVLVMSSCSKDDFGNFGEGATYLTFCFDEGTSPETNPQYYKEIDDAITNNELLYTHEFTYQWDRSLRTDYTYYYATRDMFVSSDGGFSTHSIHHGRFQNTICWWVQGYQIKNSNTILWVDYLLQDDDSFTGKNYKKYKSVYQGKNFKLSWYVSEKYYTFYENNGKMFLSNGEILTRTENGLIRDGSSYPYAKFDLSRLK